MKKIYNHQQDITSVVIQLGLKVSDCLFEFKTSINNKFYVFFIVDHSIIR